MGIGPRVASAKKMIKQHQLGIWANSDDLDEVVSSLKKISLGKLKRPQTQALGQFHASKMSAKVAQLLNHAHQQTK